MRQAIQAAGLVALKAYSARLASVALKLAAWPSRQVMRITTENLRPCFRQRIRRRRCGPCDGFLASSVGVKGVMHRGASDGSDRRRQNEWRLRCERRFA